MQQQNAHRPTGAFKKHFLVKDVQNKMQSEFYDTSVPQHQNVSGRTYAIPPDRGYTQQRPPTGYYIDQQCVDPAGGDAHIQAIRAKYSSDGKDVRCKTSQSRNGRSRNEGDHFSGSLPSSSRSDSTRQTAIEQSKKGRQLMKLTHSKASLIKVVDEGMARTQQDHCNCNKRPSANQCRESSKEMFHCGSEESNTCSSPSAGLINEKIIHPMIRKFRLLYLHNIKEEVTIMEDLEMLPHKLDEICRKMEKEV